MARTFLMFYAWIKRLARLRALLGLWMKVPAGYSCTSSLNTPDAMETV